MRLSASLDPLHGVGVVGEHDDLALVPLVVDLYRLFAGLIGYLGQGVDERLQTLQQAVTEKLDALEPNLPPLPESEATPEDVGWLFDSRRDYLEQLRHYKQR